MERKILSSEEKQQKLPQLQQYLAGVLGDNVYEDTSVSQKLEGFIAERAQNFELGIAEGKIARLTKRRDYSKHDEMSRLAGTRHGLVYKLQLDNHGFSDFYVAKQTGKIDLLDYLKPNLRQQYRHDMAKNYIQDHLVHTRSHLHILSWLCDHYEDVILPLLKGAEGLHEISDGIQQQTMRVVRIPNLHDNNTSFGRLLLQHTPKHEIHKGHEYRSDSMRIEFYPDRDIIVDLLESQQGEIERQIQRLSRIVESFAPYIQDNIKGLYDVNKQQEIIKLIQQLKSYATGKTVAEIAIQEKSIASSNNRLITSTIITSLHRRFQEQIHKAQAIKTKNQLHIESLKKYEI